jgi:hypothetical protein
MCRGALRRQVHRVSQPPTIEARRAAGVTYSTDPSSDLRLFRCEPQEMTLSTRGCADRFEKAQPTDRVVPLASRGEDNPCRSCPVGAAHAGRDLVHFAREFGSMRCPRCTFGTMRMIGNRLCVSCSNRENEVIKGENGRGNLPKRLPGLVRLPLRISINGGRPAPLVSIVAIAHIAKVKVGRDKRNKPAYIDVPRGGVSEAIMQTLRTTRGMVDFQMHTTRPPIAAQGQFAWAA